MRAGRRTRSLGAFALLAVGSTILFLLSRGRWSDPLIDSGREWIVPDALARGDLLYRDVVYWFGPFTPYFQAAFLWLFGSSFASLVVAGIVASGGALATLRLALRRVTSRREAALWTALAVPALVFMPNAGGAILGMGYRIWHAAAFAMASVAIASRGRRLRPGLWTFAAGACAGAAGLCRTEWGLAASAAAGLAAVVRARSRTRGLGDAVRVVAGFAAVFGFGLGIFFFAAGSKALVRDGHVLLTGLPQETRQSLVVFTGALDWRGGLPEMIYSAAAWAGLFLLAALAARPAGRNRASTRRALLIVIGILALTALAGGAGGAILFSAAPLVSLIALVWGLARGRGSAAAALSGCGLLGLALSYRRPFHIADSAYVAPPLLFAVVCAAGLLRIASARMQERRVRTSFPAVVGQIVAALIAVAFVGRAWQYASADGAPIAGTSGMLRARPELAYEIEELGSAIRDQTPRGSGLAVFPEGEILNLLSERPNPIRHKLYLPGYLNDANEPEVLAELERSPPAAIVIFRRPTSEYARLLFGQDYGRRVRAWIDENYRLEPFRAAGTPPRANPRFLIGIRRSAPGGLGSAR